MPSRTDLARWAATGWVGAAALHGRGAPSREWTSVAGVPVLSLGLPEVWATAGYAVGARPAPSAIEAAARWLAARSSAYTVFVRTGDTARLPLDRLGLVPAFELPALVLPLPSSVARTTPAGLTVGPGDRDAFVAVYGADMRPGLAAGLAAPADFTDPAQVHLVGRLDGRAVGCALLRLADGAGYLSAVAVLAAYRGRGIGTALSAAGTAAAAAAGCGLAVLHATEHSQPIYERLGYRQVDTHVALCRPETARG